MELTPWIWQQFTDSDGSALSAGKIYTYFSGTTVKATTYQDALGTTPNTNPIILEADGFAPGGQIFLPVGVVYSFLVTDSLGGTVKTIDDIEAKSAGTVTTDYTVMVDGSDPMPAYLGLKLSAGSNVTITPVTGGPNGTVLEIASTGGGGVTQWEVVTLGGADYLTPITGLPQKLYASDAMMAEKTVTAGAYRGLTARENYVRMDGENGTLGLNQSVTGSTNTGLFFGVNDSTQRAKIQATKNIGDPAKLEISALMTGTKTSSGWLALDADSCLTLATPTYSDVGAQQASTILGTLSALTDAHGWLHNDGAGVLSYSTPTASDVGADPAGTAAGLVANYLPLTGGTITGSLIIGDDGTDTVKFNAAILGSVTAFSDSNIDFGTSAKRFGIAWFKAFVSRSASATNTSYYANTTADTTFRFTIDASGKHTWGAGGTDALDANCNLYRYAANVLSTDGGLRVGGATTLVNLAGTGTRMVTASSTGVLGATLGSYAAPTIVTGTTYTVLASDAAIYFTGTADCTMTVLDASGSGQLVRIKNLSTNGSKVTLAYNSGDSVDGVSSPTLVIYPKQAVVLHDYADEKWGQL